MDGFYTIAEFLRLYAIGRTSAYRLVNAGQLRVTKIGKSARISKADTKAWADKLPTTGGQA